ncbi:MAG: bifunctional 5,10-methylenetetrahydrofolate dehydrogenase/5,10-methenyltetrahydrofolate cyclohydrolase [Planctomycetota bacterium]|jgi:methylenetetrahydrofolate dehydrogenase (NADP+)/methenyltetrahydrofolate cyclohydrolase|nr:bifunctional 5,10-methylenetetrahydrofolate dehydrogenase/5,10-methenyltetrahydrofolate cyclohydrolase [Planctomycetota bacterium]
MAAIIIDGKKQAEAVLAEVSEGVRRLAGIGVKPALAAIQANQNPGSDWYVQAQARHAAAQGIEHRRTLLPSDAPEKDLLAAVRQASDDPDISGIIVLTPLPPGTDHLRLVEAMDPAKDAEGVHPANLGRLMVSGRAEPIPCTAAAARELIKSVLPDLSGRRALVIGRSATVGKPLALLLLAENATVSIAHTRSDLWRVAREAEIVVAAAGASGARWRAYNTQWRIWREKGDGRPEHPNLEPLVRVDMVRRGAVVIDIGDNHIPAGLGQDGGPLLDAKGGADMRYAGDVDFAKVSEVAGFITRPRGGVGPLTNAFLLRNVVRSALLAHGLAPAGAGS